MKGGVMKQTQTQQKYQNHNLVVLELNGVKYTKLRQLIHQYENNTTLARHHFYPKHFDRFYKEAKQHITICRNFLDDKIDLDKMESQLIKATTDPGDYQWGTPEVTSSADAVDQSIWMMEEMLLQKQRDEVLSRKNFELKQVDQATTMDADQILQTIKQRQQSKGK